MALSSRSPESGFGGEKMRQSAIVSTGPSLELCTIPSTLGSSVAAYALEQLLVVEKSLQSDYFKCNEEAKTFLKDTAVAVKKLEEMRKTTIDLLEIESMELSRLYYLLETLPTNINIELEECVRDARRLNLCEKKQLQTKVTNQNNEIQCLKGTIIEMEKRNEELGEKQDKLVTQHEKVVLSLNHAMAEKATTTVFINETYTKINMEKEEIEMHKKSAQDTEEQIEKEKAEYLQKKKKLKDKIQEEKNLCDLKKAETYKIKKELEKLRSRMTSMKETVTAKSMVISDHNLEIRQIQESIKHWEQQVEDMKNSFKILENKINFFVTSKEKLDAASSTEKEEYLLKIKEITEKLVQARSDNKELQEKLNTVTRQYKIVLKEEENDFVRKQKLAEENKKQLEFMTKKEQFLLKRKVDIKNMEEGLVTLKDLLRATQEIYRKQIRILNDNMQREYQRCIFTQWKISCLQKQHARWLIAQKNALQEVTEKIQFAEQRKFDLIKQVSFRERHINEFLSEIEGLTVKLKQEEELSVIKEKKLMHKLSKYQEIFEKEQQSTKVKEEELGECLPHLQVAEENFTSRNRELEELHAVLPVLKQEHDLLDTSIFQYSRDFSGYWITMDKLKEELKHLREQESRKIKNHFEILKELENEIYVYDLKTDALLLENRRLKQYIAYMKKITQQYKEGKEDLLHNSSDLSWQLISHHTQYLSLWTEYHVTVKDLVKDGEEISKEIKALIDKLHIRDEKVEAIRIWLQGNLHELCSFMDKESRTKLKKKKKSHIKKVHFSETECTMKKILTKKN
ncbi:PREDICTED: coiled-coil domain-containing protein 175 [Condylura cristata]|uniref:coiled-coil domain-containing protein 175 n=1 Tax=Condylura cristata TaxID=143302 RepID=UPI000643D7D7|nr:PREDICTED: coiled-coil domain-containing protein 175 [Condylura cristata]